jgi:LPS-assembly protein
VTELLSNKIGVPLPYSPLYQSIHVILFGALSLSALSMSTAANAAIEDLSSRSVITSATVAAEPNTNPVTNNTPVMATGAAAFSTDNDAFLYDTTYKNETAASTEQATTPERLTEDNAASPAEALGTNDSLEENNLLAVENPTVIEEPVANTSSNSTKDIQADDDSIQRSLERLAEHYELVPLAERQQKNKVNLSDLLNLEQSVVVAPKPTRMPNGLPSNTSAKNNSLYDSSLNSDTLNSRARCEGRWIYPQANAKAALITGADGVVRPDMSLYAESDYGYYDNVDYAELSGNVIIDQGTQHIEADKIVVNLTSGVAAAQGKVMFTDAAVSPTTGAGEQLTAPTTDGGIIGVADSLAYNTETGQSTAKDVAFASVPLQAHGYAKRLNRPSETRYELDDVMFTTCPPTDRKWQLDAKNIDIDTETGRGVATNSTFRIADIPVLYLPYFNFPIDARRSSGFLTPRASIGSENGLELDIPYYFNLAPDYDATLNTHLYTNRNPMLSGEFRYLTENYGEGRLTGSYLPDDRKYDGEDRSSFFYDHYWASEKVPHLDGDITYKYVSDADYLTDFDTLGLADNNINLPRRARLSYYNDLLTGELKVETFQSLKAFTNDNVAIADKDKPYSRLPQLNLNYRLPWSEKIDITGVHDSAYFKKSIDDGSEVEKSGVRLYNKLSASYPVERAWGYVTPQVSLQHLLTSYDQDSLDDNQLDREDGRQSVFVPQMSVDAGLHLSRTGSPFGWFDETLGGYQLLSPRVKYTYSPFEEQNSLPNFDTRIASINYKQLYADSWFLGHDRLQDLHAVTPGLNYRYVDAMGVTRFDGSIAEQFYLKNGEVTLSEESPVFTEPSSGMVWEASTQPYQNFWVDLSGAVTNSYDLNYLTTELRYQPTEDSLFNVGYIKRREDVNTNQLPLSAVTASTVFPINGNWRMLAQGQYDLKRDRMLDALLGVDFEDCCFGFAVYGRRYYNDLNLSDKPNQAIMAEIRLNGLGDSTSRLTRLLSDKILGFEPVQRAWKD